MSQVEGAIEAAADEARIPSYPGWAAAGHLVVTSGNKKDFDDIESDGRQLCSWFNVVSAGYNPWQSAQMSQRLRAERRANARVSSDDAALQPDDHSAGRGDALHRALRHDGNSVLEWCLGNVVGKADWRANPYPTKSGPDQKIDAAR